MSRPADSGSQVPALDAEGIREAAARLAADVCHVLDIARCSVFLREPDKDVFVGIAAHPPDELEHEVLRYRIGGASDAMTRAVVESRAPVFVRDTSADARTAQIAVRHWKVRTLLGLPLTHAGEVIGVAWVDNADRAYPYRPEQMATAAALAAAAGDAIGRAREAHQLRARLHTVARQNQLLRDATTADQRLAQVVMSGAGLDGIVATTAELTGKPVVLYDAGGNPLVRADDGDVRVTLLDPGLSRDAAAEEVATLAAGDCRVVGPLPAADILRRHLVAPVFVGERRWGCVVVMEHRARFTAFDEYTTRRAATHVALELAAEQRATAGVRDARLALARQMLQGIEDLRAARRSAGFLGIPLDSAWVVVHVARRGVASELPVDAERLAAAIARGTGGAVLDTPDGDGIALLVAVTAIDTPRRAVAEVRSIVEAACAAEDPEGRLVVGLSTLSRDVAGVPYAHREAREVAECSERFAATARHDILAADDLGPGRMFLVNSDAVAIDRYVADVLGRLLTGEESMTALLVTLQAFFETGRSVRRSSARLHIHENTVRQRLDRVKALTGFDVAADADDQLAVQIALLIARLRGTTGLPGFGGRTAE